MSHKSIELAASIIINWVYSDSCVTLNKDVLKKQLRHDWNLTKRTLTEAECKLFVIGDDSGKIPKKLIKQFPHTHAFLDSCLT